MSLVKQRLLILFVPLLLAAPFLNRAYFVDDHFFIEIAKWIRDNPTCPYDFPTEGIAPNAALSGKDLSLRIVNPLLHHYYLAGLLKIREALPGRSDDGEERFLRLGCVLLTCLSALMTFELARRWLEHPLAATVLTLVTPVHWLTSYSLLIDSTMAFFFLSALFSFVRATEDDSIAWSGVAGLSLGAALLTKYTAVLLAPMFVAWLALNRKKNLQLKLLMLPASVSAIMLFGYLAMTRSVYGANHLLASSCETLHGFTFGKTAVLLAFLAGGTIAPLVVWFAADRRYVLAFGLIFAVLAAFFRGPHGGFSGEEAILFALWISTSLLLIVLFLGRWRSWNRPSDHFIFTWLILFLTMMIVVMQWVAVRYYMIAAPALVFLCTRLVEVEFAQRATRILSATIAVTFVFGLSLAYADYCQAESSRFIVRALTGQPAGHYFSEDFTMTYLLRQGWKPVNDPLKLSVGELVVATSVTLPIHWFLRTHPPVRLAASYEDSSHFPVKVMDASSGAGFYASAWGPLPFTFSTGPWERFYLFEIIEK